MVPPPLFNKGNSSLFFLNNGQSCSVALQGVRTASDIPVFVTRYVRAASEPTTNGATVPSLSPVVGAVIVTALSIIARFPSASSWSRTLKPTQGWIARTLSTQRSARIRRSAQTVDAPTVTIVYRYKRPRRCTSFQIVILQMNIAVYSRYRDQLSGSSMGIPCIAYSGQTVHPLFAITALYQNASRPA